MRELERKRRFQKKIYSKITIGILFLIIVLLIRAVWSVYQKKAESEINAKNAYKELRLLQEKKDTLLAQINRIQTQTGAEEEIRQKYSVSKDGEQVVVVVDSDEPLKTEEKIENKYTQKWKKFIGFFKIF